VLHRKAEVERYLTEGLPAATERELREHLRGCEGCRAFYDGQVALLRALSGRPGEPTAREERRMEALALRAAGLTAVDVSPELAAASRRAAAAETIPLVSAPARAPWWLRVGLSASPSRLAAAAAVFALLAAALVGVADRTAPAGTVVKARGLTVAGEATAAGATVRAGAELKVRAEGLAEIAVEPAGTLRLFPGTTARLQRGGAGVEVVAGKVWCRIEPAPVPDGRVRFRAVTDRGEARVLGTSFVVEKLPGGEMEVRVLSGRVAVEDAGRRGVVEVLAGQKTRVDQGPPSPAQPYSGEDEDEWWLLELLRRIGRALKEAFSP